MGGEPSHFELGVPDARRAKSFYGRLFDWEFTPTTGDNAWIETRGVRGGLHGDDDASNIEVYFAVDDLDAAVARVRELGGDAPDPEPEHGHGGRFVRCRDDQGVTFGLHEPQRG